MVKAYTGETTPIADRLTGQKIIGRMYRWEAQRYCPRCGKPNPHYKGN